MKALPWLGKNGTTRSDSWAALRISFLFFLVAALWIIFSDKLVETLFQDPYWLTLAQTVKGIGFVLVMALLVFLSIHRELAIRRAAQETMRRSEERYRTIVETADEGVWMIDAGGQTIFANAKIGQMLGYPVTGMIGKSVFDFMDDEGQRITKQNLARRSQGTRKQHDFCFRRADGSELWALLSTSPLYDADGQFSAVLAMVSDITSRRQAEQQARERLNMLEALYAGAQRLSESLNMSGLCAAITHSCVEVFDTKLAWVGSTEPDGVVMIQAHYPPNAAYIRSLTVRWDESVHGRGPVGRATRSGQPVVLSDISADPDYAPWRQEALSHGFHSSAAFPLISSNRTLGTLSVYSDHCDYFSPQRIEFFQAFARQAAAAMENVALYAQVREYAAQLERRVAERTAALGESNDELSAFVYMVTHDLRAPLRGMQGLALALLEDYGKTLPDIGQDYARRIIAAAERMEVLIRDLLAYSQVSRAQLKVNATDLADVIDEALNHFEPELGDRRAHIVVQAPMYTVNAHASTLVQIVSNLISNAVKFISAGIEARVRLWAEDRGCYVRLWVEDNGIGIADDDRERIFRAFERLHGIESYSGTGIGLAIVQRGIERMGGSVGVESRIGEGSRFWLELPRV
ncbi:MAG: PAS domain S-box protein [Acidiferrobacterales bacterium]